jgi:hypothetical protein
MQRAFATPGARDAISRHLTGLGLPPLSREGLLSAMERGVEAGEPDAIDLRDRLVAQAMASLGKDALAVVDGILDLVIAPLETLEGKA